MAAASTKQIATARTQRPSDSTGTLPEPKTESHRTSGRTFAWAAAALGYIDEVIDPRDTRIRIIRALEMLRSKSEHLPAKKHGNIPL